MQPEILFHSTPLPRSGFAMNARQLLPFVCGYLGLLCLLTQSFAANPDINFQSQIAPLLAKHCLECHSSTHAESGLNLSDRDAILHGGDSGPAINQDDWQAGLIWQMIESGEMPKGRPPLSGDEQLQLKSWLQSGAPWTGPPIDPLAFSSDRRAGYDWWSLQPAVRPELPKTKNTTWPNNEIDYFILDRLEQLNLNPAPEADRRTLIRRLSYDLIGLPPTPEEVRSFVEDNDPNAYAKLVNRLLDSPHHGERWARHWLDVVRFGETQGYERNRIRENAWQYRDWVIRALNQDLPYNQFVSWQIAGDVLKPDSFDALMATGYHVCGTWDQVGHNEGSSVMRAAARWDHMEDLVGTLGQAFLGLTTNCSRCHDHKYDPISQTEYYQLAAALGGVNQQDKERSEIRLKPTGANQHQKSPEFNGTAHVIIPKQPPVYHVLLRGDSRKQGELVKPNGLSALSRGGLIADFGLAPDAPEAERQIALANWLADAKNPLTARVLVNRFWHHHFGRGIVDTPSDFGFSGGRPTHPELLDWLANNFIQQGWSMKALHRLMVMSATYRQTSIHSNENASRFDAENRLLWRANMRRLEGEAVRDAMLFVAGELNLDIGGPSFLDMQVKQSNNAEFTDPDNTFNTQVNRRTIYRLWARSGNNPMLQAFDCPDPSVMTPVRSRTITPSQAMQLFNNARAEQCANQLSKRLKETAGDDLPNQLNLAWQLVFSRFPSAAELTLAKKFVAEHGMQQLCLVLLNTNEFIHIN